jgi:transitional endoplasmic reticulum ATPase
MENEELLSTLKSLREALQLSPDNLPLRSLYIENLLKAGQNEEARDELKGLVKKQPENTHFRFLLAGIYLQRLETTKGIVLIEDLVKSGKAPNEVTQLYIKLHIEEKRYDIAAKVYRELLLNSPACRDESIEAQLGEHLEPVASDLQTELDDLVAARYAPVPVEKPKIKFDDVGGMSQVKEEIAFKIIRPLQHKKLFAAYGKKAGGGIMLYGPPGCGKTYIARATAGETNSIFISVGIHDVLNMYVGESENKLHEIFDYARRNTPAVLFFDEADALGSSRTDMKNYAGRYTINQFLMEMDGDKYSNDGLLVLAATNAPWHLDQAFLRPGRFDRIIFVPPPDEEARIAILKIILRDKPVEDIDFLDLAKKTEGFSGADLAGMVDVAVESLLREVLHSNTEIPLRTKDLIKTLKTIRASTREWFSTAKNYVIYSNQSGLYDDVARYLKIKK